ncbi:hypothetical protein JMJ35_002824 [Cladonia borealis]|uniref:RRM domain-containing protein n=1 Tax=Cladonia borealis TaxID=184061 RepID=A0AA39R3G0_9LECA|nr:hypothetical protein JMJ35_002824 [Cladonia borealis]
MPRTKVPKALAVDGTDKLAAKAKPGDKHEKPDLTIEEATVASPRPSRKRAGDYFDFEAEEGDDAEASSKPTEAKATPPKKKTKTTTADKGEKKTKNAKSTKDDAPAKPEKKDKKEKKPKVAKDDAAPMKEKAEPKSKPKKSNAEAAKELVEDAATSVSPDVAMDQGPFEKLVGSDKGKAPATTKGAKKPAKEPKAPKETKAPKAKTPTTTAAATTQKAADVADTVTKEAKGAAEKTKKAVKDKAPTVEGPAELADAVTKEAKAGAEKVKKAAKTKAPKTETPADVAESVKKGAKDGADKVKKTAKAKAPKADTVAKAADETKKQAKTGVEKAKKAVKPKDDKKTEATASKKRKSPSGDDSNTLKADLLDPLVEHTEEITNKKQKTEKTMSKSLGDAVGGLIASAAEGANAARASLGGFASSFLGGASDAGESAGEAAQTVAKKAKGKGKAIAGDVAESSAKVAAPSPSGEDEEDDSDAEPDDHTAALLAGFESDGDDVHPPGPGFQPGQKIPELPDAKETAKKLKGIKASADEEPGVVYVGRIPHGFYEHEMRQYFSQFGEISRLRLARNKKSGASRHWAFIEFKSTSVANIVAGTMDNYLMFNHILKCKVVPKEQLHEDIWKGANKRFKQVPWNSIEGRKLEMAVGRDQWAGRVEKEKKRRESKNKKLKETLGYEFEGGALKDVDSVPVKDTAKEITNETVEEEKSLVTAGGEEGQGPVIVSEEIMTKKTKKTPKGDVKETTTTIAKKTKRALETGEEAAESATKKAKKAKKPSS